MRMRSEGRTWLPWCVGVAGVVPGSATMWAPGGLGAVLTQATVGTAAIAAAAGLVWAAGAYAVHRWHRRRYRWVLAAEGGRRRWRLPSRRAGDFRLET